MQRCIALDLELYLGGWVGREKDEKENLSKNFNFSFYDYFLRVI
jgi:hypothetical protein